MKKKDKYIIQIIYTKVYMYRKHCAELKIQVLKQIMQCGGLWLLWMKVFLICFSLWCLLNSELRMKYRENYFSSAIKRYSREVMFSIINDFANKTILHGKTKLIFLVEQLISPG